ncbi:MAG: apolipoprotein N-acyltransferase [Candidatus Omnitrophica bacterium]|nr:apolipoprotein N-acyltransferase [Candidatus Omnitrophota bacterium]
MWYRIILAVSGAFLLVAAHPSLNYEFLAWCGLVPLFIALDGCGPKGRFLVGYCFGVVFFGGILYWLVNVSVPGAVGLVLILALLPAIFSLYPITGAVQDIVAVPGLWVLTEGIRTYLGTGFPWALLGYSQYLNLKVIQIADITGVYGVSFLIVAVNVLIFTHFFKRSGDRWLQASVCCALLVFTLFYGFWNLRQPYSAKPVSIGIIQGNIPQDRKWDPNYKRSIVNTYCDLSEQAATAGPDIIMWPETAVPDVLDGDDETMERLSAVARSSGACLLAGAIKEKEGKYYNSAYLMSPEGQIVSSYDKMHLVPFGEYVPFDRYVSWFRTLIDKPIGDFNFGQDWTLFKIRSVTTEREDNRIMREIRFNDFGVLICFEDIFPDIARGFVNRGALFLVNITNDAWFGKTSAPFQHLSASVFRAVENRVPLVRAANTGVSCIINQNGAIKTAIKKNGEETFVAGYAVGSIYPVMRRTVYTLYGNAFLGICCILTVIGIITRRAARS